MHNSLNSAGAPPSLAPSADNGAKVDSAGRTDSVTSTGAYQGYVLPTPPFTWQEDAARDRDRAIGILKDARQRATELFTLVDSYDVRLSGELASFRRKLDERLAMCLLAREDAGA